MAIPVLTTDSVYNTNDFPEVKGVLVFVPYRRSPDVAAVRYRTAVSGHCGPGHRPQAAHGHTVTQNITQCHSSLWLSGVQTALLTTCSLL